MKLLPISGCSRETAEGLLTEMLHRKITLSENNRIDGYVWEKNQLYMVVDDKDKSGVTVEIQKTEKTPFGNQILFGFYGEKNK